MSNERVIVGSRFRPIVGLLTMLLGTGCDTALLSAPDHESDGATDEAIAAATYVELVAVSGWEDANAYCVSQGEDPGPRDPSSKVLELLASAEQRFVPVSTCLLNYGYLRESDKPAQLLHVGRVEVEGDRATVSAYFQRSDRAAASVDCELKKSAGKWHVEVCGTSAGNDERAIRADLYLRLASAIPWLTYLRPDLKAFCVSQGSWEDRQDPPVGVFFPLIKSTDQRYFIDSTCTRSGLPLASGNAPAVRLNLEEVTLEEQSRSFSFALQYDSTVIRRRCELRQAGSTWVTQACASEPASPQLTEDDVAIRVALYKYHAVSAYPTTWNGNSWCIEEDGEPAPAVMAGLAGDERDFYPVSECTHVPLGGFDTPSGERAGNVAVVLILRQGEMAEATVNGLYPFGGRQWHCRLEKSSTGSWSVEMCKEGSILN